MTVEERVEALIEFGMCHTPIEALMFLVDCGDVSEAEADEVQAHWCGNVDAALVWAAY